MAKSYSKPQQPDDERGKYPRKIGAIVNQLIARRGYAQLQAADVLQQAVAAAVGEPLAASVRPGNVRRGVLELYADDSVTLQELTFMKRTILKKIRAAMPDGTVTDIRFRIRG